MSAIETPRDPRWVIINGIRFKIDWSILRAGQEYDSSIQDLRSDCGADLRVVDDVICTNMVNDSNHLIPLIPSTLRPWLLSICHDSSAAGHPSSKETEEILIKFGYWNEISNDTAVHVNACRNELCHKGTPNELKRPTRASRAVEVVSVDHLGPLTGRNGKVHLMIVADQYSNYLETFEVSDSTAITTVNMLVNRFIPQHGIPSYILTRRGSGFIADMTLELKSWGLNRTQTTALEDAELGIFKYNRKTIREMLMRISKTSARTEWEDTLQLAVVAFNNIPNEIIKESPNSVIYGKNINVHKFAKSLPRVALKRKTADTGNIQKKLRTSLM